MATPFRSARELLCQYAEYHRDRRNIATHFVGVPLIVFSIGVLLAGTSFSFGGIAVPPAWLAFGTAAAWYLTRGEPALGLATVFGIGLLIALAHPIGDASLVPWTAWWLGLFVVGWTFQFVGHYYEGRKPAFADDLVGLLVGPMFVTLEMLAPTGLFKNLLATIERHAGPTTIRDLAHPATR